MKTSKLIPGTHSYTAWYLLHLVECPEDEYPTALFEIVSGDKENTCHIQATGTEHARYEGFVDGWVSGYNFFQGSKARF